MTARTGWRGAAAALPLIAVTTSEMRHAALDAATAEADPPRREMVLGLRYVEAIGRAGGIGVVVPPLPGPAIPALLDRVDGVCLSGGPDLHPDAYGAAPHPALGPTEPALDAFELALARAADERDMPVLAICRGAQVLNVARGGPCTSTCPTSPARRFPTASPSPPATRRTASRSRPTAGWRRSWAVVTRA